MLTNIFLMPGDQSLASLLRSQPGQTRAAMLESIILETERLSPPEIGVMRRAQQDIVLPTTLGGDGRHDVPAGHDV
jgi:hypothetical protein